MDVRAAVAAQAGKPLGLSPTWTATKNGVLAQ